MKRGFSVALISCCGLAFGQGPVSFDVASVRPAAPPTGIAAMIFQQRGGPGSADPERIAYTNIPMRQLLMFAYGLTQPYQLQAPNSVDNDKYDIEAKIPAGATREQFNVMLQKLLIERFHLVVRHDSRSETAYELVVAKGGVKMKEAVQAPLADQEPVGRGGRGGVSLSKDKDGLPELAPGRSTRAILPLPNGNTRISGRMQSMEDILAMCRNQAGKPVVDKTGLSGKYDFNLDFRREGTMSYGTAAVAPAGDASDPTPDFVTAIQQLGLKLEEKKESVDVLVVEHVEKVPTEN